MGKSLTVGTLPESLPVSPLSLSPASPTTSWYSLTLRGPGERRNKTLNNLFGETVSEEEQIMFR